MSQAERQLAVGDPEAPPFGARQADDEVDVGVDLTKLIESTGEWNSNLTARLPLVSTVAAG